MTVLDGFGMPAVWDLSIVVPTFKGKGDIRNCTFNRAMKIHGHRMNVVKRVLEKCLVV